MYLTDLFYDNVACNGAGHLCIPSERGGIRKWTLLSPDQAGTELLRLIALVCGGGAVVPRLDFDHSILFRAPEAPIQLEVVLAPHRPLDGRSESRSLLRAGVRMSRGEGVFALNAHQCHLSSGPVRARRLSFGDGNSRYFVLGYGSELSAQGGTDRFDFRDPFFRAARINSLFSARAALSDPVAFLRVLHYKAISAGRHPKRRTLDSLSKLLATSLDVDTRTWMERPCDFQTAWAGLSEWQKPAVLLIVDAVRHVTDAAVHIGEPLKIPGVLLLERPDRLVPADRLRAWLTLLDSLFPRLQILATLPESAREAFPPAARDSYLPLPAPLEPKAAESRRRVSPGSVLLWQVDGRLPNVALMKLSQHFKTRGRQVLLGKGVRPPGGADTVYASCIFSRPSVMHAIQQVREQYGDALTVGGSGVDIDRRLPPEVEVLPADFDLYPELGDRAIGFLTRGCPNRCAYCIVPRKEGGTRQVSDLETLLAGRQKLILLDDNILSHPGAHGFLEEMVFRKLMVNFNQTLDIRLVDERSAALLRRIHASNSIFTRRVYHFSLSQFGELEEVREKHHILGFRREDNVEFIYMFGYNTTLEDDVRRLRFLRSLPGAYVFMQQYLPLPDGPEPSLTDFFGDSPDVLIDELVRILFPQNMKSMEKYYRWLSLRYARTFGRLHLGLVDTIFRYNYRAKKGEYLATLAGTSTDQIYL